jgi:hypothetical protein
MAEIVKSIFGAYADRLQTMIDNALERFAPTFFERFFDWGPLQVSLTFMTVIGRSRIEAAASIVDRDGLSPLRSRAALEKLNGEIPAIKEKFPMSESEYRSFYVLQNIPMPDGDKRRQLLDLLFNDVKNAGDSTHKRIDYMVLEAISTGQITVTVANNPDGAVFPIPIPIGMPAENKVNAAINWNLPATATPIADIMAIQELASPKGQTIGKMLMTRATWIKMSKTVEVQNYINAFNNVGKGNALVTLDNVNTFLGSMLLPPIELIDAWNSIGIEKDGKITVMKPFVDANVALIPGGKLGIIHNATALESLNPVAGVSYAKFNRTLISKFGQNEPFREFTKAELNAFPGFEVADQMYLLSTTVAF